MIFVARLEKGGYGARLGQVVTTWEGGRMETSWEARPPPQWGVQKRGLLDFLRLTVFLNSSKAQSL